MPPEIWRIYCKTRLRCSLREPHACQKHPRVPVASSGTSRLVAASVFNNRTVSTTATHTFRMQRVCTAAAWLKLSLLRIVTAEQRFSTSHSEDKTWHKIISRRLLVACIHMHCSYRDVGRLPGVEAVYTSPSPATPLAPSEQVRKTLLSGNVCIQKHAKAARCMHLHVS